MECNHRSAALLVALIALLIAPAASAEEIALKARYQPGDSYLLSLQTNTQTALRSKGARRPSFEEDVQLEYGARVVVLAVDANGQPTRERHEEVRLAFVRPGETGSLFKEHAAFEVRRDGDGAVQLFANEKRMSREVEEVVAGVLATQFEYSLGPALFDPGRSVAIGESWELDARLARRFLNERGVGIIDFDGPATATLERKSGDDGDAALVIHYRIAVDRWQPDQVHPNSVTSASEGHVEGEIELASAAHGQPLRHTSKQVMSVAGVVTASRVAEPVKWSLARSRATEQSTRIVKDALAAKF